MYLIHIALMKELQFIPGSFLLLILNLNVQESDQVIVTAGINVADCFPPEVRYFYPNFTPGQVILHNGNHNSVSLNYNFLFVELEIFRKWDTTAIVS